MINSVQSSLEFTASVQITPQLFTDPEGKSYGIIDLISYRVEQITPDDESPEGDIFIEVFLHGFPANKDGTKNKRATRTRYLAGNTGMPPVYVYAFGIIAARQAGQALCELAIRQEFNGDGLEDAVKHVRAIIDG